MVRVSRALAHAPPGISIGIRSASSLASFGFSGKRRYEGESIEIISELGLILLLFIIGLELNVKEVLAAGRQLLVAGFGQFVICVALGLGVFGLFGLPLFGKSSDGLYLAIMCGLSSTAI